MKAKFYINGTEINEPNNYDELSIECSYDRDANTQSVSINNWDFGVGQGASDAVKLIEYHISQGLIGGVGVFEGLPFSIELYDEKTKTFKLFDGYIDVSRGKIICDNIVAPAVEQGRIDWLNDVADSVTYEYLFDNKYFSPAKFIPVPYCINKKQSSLDIIVMLVSIFVLKQELQRIIAEISAASLQAANPFEAVGAVANLAFKIIYASALFLSMVILIKDLYNALIQPVKYHNVMYVKDLIEIGLDYFGLTLSSSILQTAPFNKLAVMPEKFNIKEDNGGAFERIVGLLKGDKNEQNGFYKGTVGQLLRDIKQVFNAKIIIDNGVLYFEKQDFTLKNPKFQLPDLIDAGYEFNHEDFKSNRIISFQVDFEDRNTVQEYAGTAYQVIQTPLTIVNKKMVLTKGIEEIRLPFALAKRKKELNFIEKLMKLLIKVITFPIDIIFNILIGIINTINFIIKLANKIVKALNAVGVKVKLSFKPIPTLTKPNFLGFIENRIDMLMMESDYVNIPKLFLVEDNTNFINNKLTIGNEDYVNARYLYENYHYFSNFVTTNGWNNQALIRDFEEIPFCFEDYEKVKANGNILDVDGQDCELINLKFNPIKQTATGKYKQRKIYTNNLKIKTLYPNE